MREILFRGKITDNDKWVYGVPVKATSIDESEMLIIKNIFDCEEYACRGCDFEPVVLKTIGEFTGLTDKNGKKIFEGDIVKYGDTVHKVIFENRNNTAYFGLVYSPLETRPFGNYQDLRQIEVIGNIHDNPKILKKE